MGPGEGLPKAVSQMRSISTAPAHGRRLALAFFVVSAAVTGLVGPSPDPTPPVGRAEVVAEAGELTPGAMRELASAVGAELIGFTWTGDRSGVVEFRVLRAGVWSPWNQVAADPTEGPDLDSPEHKGRVSAGPLWVGGDSRRIQVRVVRGSLKGLTVHALDPQRARSSLVSPAAADASRPGITSRSGWGADESWRSVSSGCDGQPEYAAGGIRMAVVHHTDTANDYAPEDVPAILRAIYSFHVFSNGWCDIGYNLVVDRFGRAWEGRAGGVDRPVIGAHAAGFNTASTGVAVLGRFQDDVVPAAAYAGLRELLLWKTFHHGVDPLATVAVTAGATGDPAVPKGSVVMRHGVVGHRDLSSTVCPGDKAASLLPTLRQELSDLQAGTPTHPLAGWQPDPGDPAVATVDAQGRVVPAGSQPAVTQSARWPGWDPVRGAVRSGSGGYVLDLFGGLHPFGGAPRTGVSGYWPSGDITRGVAGVALPGGGAAGYVLDLFGGIHPFGGAPRVPASGYWPGWDIARDVDLDRSGRGGYVLTGFGSLHPFGGAPAVSASGYWSGWDIARAVGLRPDGRSGWVLTALGSLHPFGGAPAVSSSLWSPHAPLARDVVVNQAGDGGWVVDDSGRLWPFGKAAGIEPHLTYVGQGLGRAGV